MNPSLVFLLIKAVYSQFLRPLVVKAINDPNSEWDDFVLARLDALFDYKP